MKKILLILTLLLFGFTKGETNYMEPINYLSVYNLILETGIEFPDIVFAQSVLESGHYKSKLFQTNNNIFGMRLPKKRETVAKGQNNGYATYLFWEDSIEDYWFYQEYIFKRKKMTRSQYFSFLDRTYAETPGYSKKLKKIILNFKEILYEAPKDRNDGELCNNRPI